MEAKAKKYIRLSVFAAAFVIAWFASRYVMTEYVFNDDSDSIEAGLKYAASEINKGLPKMIDAETRLDNIVADNGTFRYNNTMVNFTEAELDVDFLVETMQTSLVNEVCTTKGMERFLKDDIPLIYAYYDNQGKELATITIRAEQCDT